jgi:mRNA-degrading endonuclease toxin of MazEF toxin-antitoxin module
MTIQRGEVRDYGKNRVVVISADSVSGAGRPWCAPIVRQIEVPPVLATLVVATREPDPVTGAILLMEARTLPVDSLGPATGMMIGATLARINDGIKTMFDLL